MTQGLSHSGRFSCCLLWCLYRNQSECNAGDDACGVKTFQLGGDVILTSPSNREIDLLLAKSGTLSARALAWTFGVEQSSTSDGRGNTAHHAGNVDVADFYERDTRDEKDQKSHEHDFTDQFDSLICF